MICLFYAISVSEIYSDIVGTTAYFFGSGSLTQSLYQSSGNFKGYAEVILGEGITNLPDFALQGSSELSYIYISSSVTYVSSKAFRFCNKIKIINIAQNNSNYCVEQGFLLSIDKTKLVKAPCITDDLLIIPHTVTEILAHSFHLCAIKSLEITQNISKFGSCPFIDSSIIDLTFHKDIKIETLDDDFLSYTHITKIVVPKSVKKISSAFKSKNLLNIEFESGSHIQTIGSYSFSGSAVSRLVLPEGTQFLESQSLSSMSSLTYISIPSTVLSIASDAFKSTSNLETIICSNNSNFISVDDLALYSSNRSVLYACSVNIKSLEIGPEMVIGDALLQGCKFLVDIIVNNNERYSAKDGVLYNKDNSIALAVVGGISEATIIERCKIIGKLCCSNCKKLIKINLPSTLTNISQSSFENSLITSIVIPDSVQELGVGAFKNSKLELITFGNSQLVRIAASCFYNAKLTKIIIPPKILKIEDQTFRYCRSLVSFGFAQGSICTSMGINALYECGSLKTAFISKSVKYIGDECFYNCYNMDITFEEDSEIETISTNSFYQCNISELRFGQSLKNINSYSFSFNQNLRSVDLKDTRLAEIGSSAFEGCKSLETVILPIVLQKLSPFSFIRCDALLNVSVENCQNFAKKDYLIYDIDFKTLWLCPGGVENATIANGINKLGDCCFYFCSKLSSVLFPTECNIVSIPSKTFFQCVLLSSITIPPLVEEVLNGAFYSCSSLSIVRFDDGSLLQKIDDSTFEGCTHLSQVIFGSSELSSIGAKTFFNCTELTTIKLPSSLQKIGESAFAECRMLQTIEFKSPSRITEIKPGTFMNCISLVSISLPESLVTLEAEVFSGCSNLSEIILTGKSIKRIEKDALNDLRSIKSIVFEQCNSLALEEIGMRAFAYTSIQNITVPPSQTIGDGIFEGCASLTNVSFSNISKITPRMFYGCVSLMIDLLELQVQSIEEEAFYGCLKLQTHNQKNKPFFNEKLATIGKAAFRRALIGSDLVLGIGIESIGESAFVGTDVKSVKFCGKSDVSTPGSLSAFDAKVVAYVPYNFEGIMLCGAPASKILDKDCQMPSIEFSISNLGIISNNILRVASLLADNEGGNE